MAKTVVTHDEGGYGLAVGSRATAWWTCMSYEAH